MDTETAAREAIKAELQTWPAGVLAEVCKGNVGVEYLAQQELKARGLNYKGVWIGFEAAKKQD